MKKTLISLGILTVLIPSFALASFDVSIKYGSRGAAVEEVQEFLQDGNYYTGKIDGRFGLGMLRAVKAFQLANRLTPDGYFGKGSRAKANELLAAELKSSDDAEIAENGSIGAPLSEDANAKLLQQLIEQNKKLSSITQSMSQASTKPTIISFSSSKNQVEVGDSVVISYKADNATVCTYGTEGSNVQIPFVGNLPESQFTATLSFEYLKENSYFGFQLICADKDWNTAKQVIHIPLSPVREVGEWGIFQIDSNNLTRLEATSTLDPFINGVQRGDILTLTFNNNDYQKTLGENELPTWNSRGGATIASSYHFPRITNLNPNTEYPWTLKVQRANMIWTKSGVAKTLAE